MIDDNVEILVLLSFRKVLAHKTSDFFFQIWGLRFNFHKLCFYFPFSLDQFLFLFDGAAVSNKDLCIGGVVFRCFLFIFAELHVQFFDSWLKAVLDTCRIVLSIFVFERAI